MSYESPNIGKYCIVRARDAGVHCGIIKATDGRSVHLTEARRIWRWHGAFTLSELSQIGPAGGEYTRIAIELPSIEILDACEIIPCSAEAERKMREAPNG